MTAVDTAIRFHHFGKNAELARFGFVDPDLPVITADLLGLSPNEVGCHRDAMADQVRRSVQSLLDQGDVRRLVEGLPFRAGDTVVALGDSLTDDLLSWAYHLQLLIQEVLPELDVRVVNAGYSGDTSADVISRLDVVLASRPAWVLQLVGTNDARRHGSRAHQVLTPSETSRNLATIRDIIAVDSDARLVRMTPPPVLESRAAGSAEFAERRISWRADDVDRIASDLVEVDEQVIDVRHRIRPRIDDFIGDDGVHPTIAGQRAILRGWLDGLNDLSRRASSASSPPRKT